MYSGRKIPVAVYESVISRVCVYLILSEFYGGYFIFSKPAPNTP